MEIEIIAQYSDIEIFKLFMQLSFSSLSILALATTSFCLPQQNSKAKNLGLNNLVKQVQGHTTQAVAPAQKTNGVTLSGGGIGAGIGGEIFPGIAIGAGVGAGEGDIEADGIELEGAGVGAGIGADIDGHLIGVGIGAGLGGIVL